LGFARIFYARDVHGSEKTYIKFLNAASFYKSQVLILGGDITGKVIVPPVKSPDGYGGKFCGIDRLAKNDSDLSALEKEIRDRATTRTQRNLVRWLNCRLTNPRCNLSSSGSCLTC